MKKQLLIFVDFILHLLPVSKTKAYFKCFAGQYADNPKYISEKLHEINPSVSIYWEMQENSKLDEIPDYVKIVNANSFKKCYYKNRCKIIVETGPGYYTNYEPRKIMYQIKKILLTNNKQYDLSTWHGTPIKCIGAQIPGYENWSKDNNITTSSGMLSGSKYLSNILKKAFVGTSPILELGTPRTDILFNKSHDKYLNLKRKLGIPEEKKVILYAPTFRNNIEDSGVKQIQLLDFDKLLRSLELRFGGSWIFVMRAHPGVQSSVNRVINLSGDEGKIMNGNKHQDMMEYLFVSDILLTDYSSSAFDFALTNKICLLFAHDRIDYESNDRGMYEPLSFLPFPFANSFEELIDVIVNFDAKEYEDNRQKFLTKIGCFEDGHASERCVAHLLEKSNEL